MRSCQGMSWAQLIITQPLPGYVTKAFQPALQLHQLGHVSLVFFSLSRVKLVFTRLLNPDQLCPDSLKNPEHSDCETPVNQDCFWSGSKALICDS